MILIYDAWSHYCIPLVTQGCPLVDGIIFQCFPLICIQINEECYVLYSDLLLDCARLHA